MQAWPNSAACWSPATPATGMPSFVTPNRPHVGRTSGSIERGTPKRAHSSSDQDSSRMSNSEVRLAFVVSVTCSPVSFHNSHESIVPAATSGVSSTCPSVKSHASLVAEK